MVYDSSARINELDGNLLIHEYIRKYHYNIDVSIYELLFNPYQIDQNHFNKIKINITKQIKIKSKNELYNKLYNNCNNKLILKIIESKVFHDNKNMELLDLKINYV